jgi:hypothetical protein
VNEEADLFRQRRLSEANLLGRFMDELSPEQRRMLMERMGRDRKPPPQIPPRILEKFDRDGDGHLNPEEMREARREMERRRREMADRPFPPPPGMPPQQYNQMPVAPESMQQPPRPQGESLPQVEPHAPLSMR